jgi:DNA-directed RNA polymerase specialized sigma24 family protein
MWMKGLGGHEGERMRADDLEPVTAPGEPSGSVWFESFQSDGQARLRVALIAAYGVEVGTEAAADASAYAWEHRERLAAMPNPIGYLFRVGQSASRRHLRWRRRLLLPPVPPTLVDQIEPDLPRALAQLTDRQRLAVTLVHVRGWTHEEAAEALGVDVSTVRTHLARGLSRLRSLLGEDYR